MIKNVIELPLRQERVKHDVNIETLGAVATPTIRASADITAAEDAQVGWIAQEALHDLEFIERTQDAKVAEDKYAAAVRYIDEAYAESMKRAGTWAKMSAEQRDAEFVRLNKEIKRLEVRRDKEEKEYKTISKLLIKGDEHTEKERIAK